MPFMTSHVHELAVLLEEQTAYHQDMVHFSEGYFSFLFHVEFFIFLVRKQYYFLREQNPFLGEHHPDRQPT